MKTVLYSYVSSMGTFWMQPQPEGRVLLGIDRHRLGTYSSARLAAHAVYERSTGWPEWDYAATESRPASLTQWKRGTPKRSSAAYRPLREQSV